MTPGAGIHGGDGVTHILLASIAVLQTGTPIVPAVKTAAPPCIDGLLTDQPWRQAAFIDTVMTLYGPVHGDPMTDRTRIMFLYDDDCLYVGFRLFDSSPGTMNDALCDRDDYNPGEWIALILDTWGNGRQAFSFEVNLANSQMDSRINEQGHWDYSWDAVWSSATSRDDSGWVCEMAIPMTQLRFPSADSQDWGFNVQRVVTRGAQNGWLILSETTSQMDVRNFATLAGLEGLHSSAGVELRPYAAGRSVRNGGSGGWDGEIEAGADLKIGISSSVVADFTVNPDFGQVEADEARMNLSHFELFLEERRPFFLEAGDIFDMPFNLFYSRRIGAVTPFGSVIPILGGAKVSGTLPQGLSFGFLDALTGQVTEEGGISAPMTNYGILRLEQGFGPLSHIGFSAASVDVPSQDSLDSYSSRSGAIDGCLRIGENAVLTGAVARSWNPGDREGSACSAGTSVQTEDSFIEAGLELVEDDFDADAAGFTTSTGFWNAYAHAMHFIELGGPFRRGNSGVFTGWTEDLDGNVTGRDFSVWLEMPFRGGGSLHPGVSWNGPRFDEWEGPEGTSYPSSWSGSLEVSTDWYAPFHAGLEIEGGMYSQEGTFEAAGADLVLRPGPAVSMELDADIYRTFNARCYNWDAGVWDSRNTEWRSASARLGWMFGPDAGLRVFSQYSRFVTDFDLSDPMPGEELTFNALYSLQYRPGSMLYLLGELLTDREGSGSWGRAQPGLFAKVTWFEAF